MFKLSVAPSAPVSSSRPTLKDYMNAGGVPRPSAPGGIPYPGYINPTTNSHQGYQQPPNPATTSHQGYQQPHNLATTSYQGYKQPPNSATISHQGYQQPQNLYQAQPQANINTRFQPPTTSQSYQVDYFFLLFSLLASYHLCSKSDLWQ